MLIYSDDFGRIANTDVHMISWYGHKANEDVSEYFVVVESPTTEKRFPLARCKTEDAAKSLVSQIATAAMRGSTYVTILDGQICLTARNTVQDNIT